MSVCLSVTRQYCLETPKHIPKRFYQRFSGNHTILEFFDTKRYGNIPTQNP